MFQLKSREAICIPKGKTCEIDTIVLSGSTLYVFAFLIHPIQLQKFSYLNTM